MSKNLFVLHVKAKALAWLKALSFIAVTFFFYFLDTVKPFI